jgi:hypothetical protein
LAQAATRDILLLGLLMLTGLSAMGSDNFILKAISGPDFVPRHSRAVSGAFIAKV